VRSKNVAGLASIGRGIAVFSRTRLRQTFVGAVVFIAMATSTAPVSAADITAANPRIENGRLVITGKATAAGMKVRLDAKAGAGFTVTAGANPTKAFTFSLVYLPSDCIVTLQKVNTNNTLGAPTNWVVANCGPTNLVQTIKVVEQPPSIDGGQSSFAFVGTPKTVTLTATQRLTVSMSLTHKLPTGSTGAAYLAIAICYKRQGSNLQLFGPISDVTTVAEGFGRDTISSTVVPGIAGKYSVGFCAQNANSGAIQAYILHGWIQITNS
jgi:hypothetical protein